MFEFCIKAPAQPPATAAVMYTAPTTAPALHVTAPAQHPWLCRFVYLALFSKLSHIHDRAACEGRFQGRCRLLILQKNSNDS